MTTTVTFENDLVFSPRLGRMTQYTGAVSLKPAKTYDNEPAYEVIDADGCVGYVWKGRRAYHHKNGRIIYRTTYSTVWYYGARAGIKDSPAYESRKEAVLALVAAKSDG